MIEYTFAAEIPEEDKPIILESKIYKQWLEASEKKFKITKVHFASVDYFTRRRSCRMASLCTGLCLCADMPWACSLCFIAKANVTCSWCANRALLFLKRLRSKSRRGFSTGRATFARWRYRNSKKKRKSRPTILNSSI